MMEETDFGCLERSGFLFFISAFLRSEPDDDSVEKEKAVEKT